ncbi:BQ2448_65 [Microbotryum intermedium]|uniref:GTP cyclohydrolase II n=1 Tax=Microbotryum intermedium TaxID=269621 RepID=A0A238F7V0_9BASI|nr:BQ2448_65 [Microbotryum intermedium]
MAHHTVTAGDLDLLQLLTSPQGLPTGNSLIRQGALQKQSATTTTQAASSECVTPDCGCSGHEPAESSAQTTSAKTRSQQQDRRPPVDPLLVAAAAAAGPDVTRNHYLHEFFPHTLAYASCDDERIGFEANKAPARRRIESQQAPRRIRLALEQAARTQAMEEQRAKAEQAAKATAASAAAGAASTQLKKGDQRAEPLPLGAKLRRLSMSDPETIKLLRQPPPPFRSEALDSSSSSSSWPPPSPSSSIIKAASTSTAKSSAAAPVLPPIQVRCEVRTRIPTPHGHIFLHLYTNNHDSKEHLAFVADQAQMDALHPETDLGPPQTPFIRSTSLDQEWREGETEMERIVRGAYMGRLSATSINPSTPTPLSPNFEFLDSHEQEPDSQHHYHHHHHSEPHRHPYHPSIEDVDPPLVRIHSECFTGETIGSQRCDCGEQLDEAFRLITLAQRGVIVYLRQEGRGIGLLEKMRAYNLQDLGHDTVAANLMLGHGADQRVYDIAGAILRDLQVGRVKLMTNNPDKIQQIEKEGVEVVERVAMVPRSWIPTKRTTRKHHHRKGGKGAAGHRSHVGIMSGSALLQLATESMYDAASAVQSHTTTANASEDEGHESDDRDYSDDDDDDEGDYEDHSSDDSSASHNLRRAGVGMIGASVTRSAELDKYLKTKIERMGHMLDLPDAAASPNGSGTHSRSESPLPTHHGAPHHRPRLHSRKSSGTRSRTTTAEGAKLAHGENHPLASSVVSLDAGFGPAAGLETEAFG